METVDWQQRYSRGNNTMKKIDDFSESRGEIIFLSVPVPAPGAVV